MEWWFFPNRESLLESANFVDEDLLGANQTLLGKSLSTCIAGLDDPGILNLSELSPQSLRTVTGG